MIVKAHKKDPKQHTNQKATNVKSKKSLRAAKQITT